MSKRLTINFNGRISDDAAIALLGKPGFREHVKEVLGVDVDMEEGLLEDYDLEITVASIPDERFIEYKDSLWWDQAERKGEISCEDSYYTVPLSLEDVKEIRDWCDKVILSELSREEEDENEESSK